MSKKAKSSKIKKPLAKKEGKSKKSLAADIVKAAEARKKETEKAAKEATKAKEATAKAKRGELIAMASVEGHELSRSYEQSTVDVLGQMLGKKFEVTLGGASIKSGEELSEAEAAKAVATLAEVTERNDTVRSTTMLALGGVVIGIKKQFGEEAGDRLIQQTVSLIGKSKHTIQEAERVVEWANSVFKNDHEAIGGLTYTHLQELKNGSRDQKGNPTIEPAELRKIVKKVREGKSVAAGKKADGSKIEQRKVLSCAETRELLVEAGGGKKKSKAKKSKTSKDEGEHLFFYVSDNGDVKWSTGLNLAIAKAGNHLIINATDKTVINDKGSLEFQIRELEPENVVPIQEPAKAEPAKAEKPAKAKKAVGSSTSIPD